MLLYRALLWKTVALGLQHGDMQQKRKKKTPAFGKEVLYSLMLCRLHWNLVINLTMAFFSRCGAWFLFFLMPFREKKKRNIFVRNVRWNSKVRRIEVALCPWTFAAVPEGLARLQHAGVASAYSLNTHVLFKYRTNLCWNTLSLIYGHLWFSPFWKDRNQRHCSGKPPRFVSNWITDNG